MVEEGPFLPLMSSWIYHGQKRVFVPQADISLQDRAFRYGMALFETMRMRNRRPLFLREHLDLLEASAARVGLPMPQGAREACENFFAVKINGSSTSEDADLDGDGVVRLHLTAGPGPFAALPENARTQLYLTATPTARLADEHDDAQSGSRVCLASQPEAGGMAGVKSHNYWSNLEALHQAIRLGFDEAVRYRPDGELVSFCTGNLFMVNGAGEILTPRQESGCRPGVIRSWILSKTGDSSSGVYECRLEEADLLFAREIWITNSGRGIEPCRALGERLLERAIGHDWARRLELVLR